MKKKQVPNRAATAGSGRVLAWIGAAVVGLYAVFEAYAPALEGPFVFDDRYLPFFAPGMGELSFWSWIRGVRPFLMASFWVNYRWSGVEPQAYHALNLLFHFLCGAMAVLILRRLLEWAGVQEGFRTLLAVLGGALFLLHPVQTESVAYVASRSENLSVLFFYAAWAVFVYRGDAGISWLRAIAVAGLFTAAVLTKEHTLVLPALLLFTAVFWRPDSTRRDWRLWALLGAGAIPAAAFVWRVLRTADTAGFAVKGVSWYEYSSTQCRAIWVYVRLFVLPYGQNADYDFQLSHSLLDHGAWLGLLALIAASVAAWNYRKRFPLAGFGWFVFLLLLAPTSSVVPIQDAVAERRVYLPFAGLLLVALEFVRRWRTTHAVLASVLGGAVLACGLLTHQRSQVWRSSLALWQDTVAKSPASARPRFQLAYALYEEGRCAEAVENYAAVARLQAMDARLAVDWGLALDCAGRPAEAIEKLRLAHSAHSWALAGMVYGKQGRSTEALEALAEAEKIDPRFEMTYVYRGNVYAVSGDKSRAAAEYRHALQINPGNSTAQDALARIR